MASRPRTDYAGGPAASARGRGRVSPPRERATCVTNPANQAMLASIQPFLGFFNGPIGGDLAATPASATSRSATPTRCRCRATSRRSASTSSRKTPDWFAYKLSEPNVAGGRRAEPDRADRARLGSGRRRDDERRVRRDRGRDAGDRRARRRGRLPVAAVVLLRGPDPRRGRRAGPGAARAAGVRPRPRRDRRGDHAADAGGRWSTRPHNPSGRVYPLGRSRGAGRRRCARPRRGSATRSSSSRTSRTTGSCSTAGRSTARPRSTRTRSSRTRTARRCSRRGCGSAT